ncbi:MAG: uncharacterized protein KVP18_004012 [Porospora cf. gigantea A]|uniref:uncharacterized protein n=1 Tax=Porospora cf. gigantea A TaxID=2853593 RepID=UPI0035597553|nr:MAG: hypothetical protein KVP18_004012 [Porospora cf. gigantea A]
MEEKSGHRRFLTLLGLVVSYWITDIFVSIHQKKYYLSFYPFPAFVTTFQNAFSFMLFWPMATLGHISGIRLLQSCFPLARYRFSTAIKILPVSFIFYLSITFSIYVLSAVKLSKVDALKSLGILFSTVLQRILLDKKTSFLGWVGVAIICSAFFVAVGDVPAYAAAVGVTAALLSSLRGVTVSKAMRLLDNNPGTFLMYNSSLQAVCGLISAPLLDITMKPASLPNPLDIARDNIPILLMHVAINSSLALLGNILSFSFLSMASPASFQICNILKNAMFATTGIVIEATEGIPPTLSIISPVVQKLVGGFVFMLSKMKPKERALSTVELLLAGSETPAEKGRCSVYMFHDDALLAAEEAESGEELLAEQSSSPTYV